MAGQTEIKSRTILCIPGNWKDRSQLVTSIASANMGEYLFAGKVILNIKTGQGFSMEIDDRDERMKESFEAAGLVNQLSDEFLERIDQHNYVVYIIGDTGNLADAKAIAEAGQAVLKAGGIGLKVESTGKAFTAEHWTRLLTDFEESSLYEMYVLDSISDGEGTVYTCGMHNLGLRDAIISELDFQEAVELLSIFGYYQLIDKPVITEHQTFSTSHNAPVYEITDERAQPNLGDELFENPFGMWRLNLK